MKKIIQLILITGIISFSVYSQDNNNLTHVQQVINELKSRNENFHVVSLFHAPEQRTIQEIKGGVKTYFHYTIDKKELQKVFNANYEFMKFVLPMPNGSFINLLLTKHKIVTDDFKLTTTNQFGIQEIKYIPGIFYFGVIEKAGTRSIVTVSILNNELSCVIANESGKWNLGHLEKNDNEYIYYNDELLDQAPKFTCGTIDNGGQMKSNQPNSITSVSNCVRIFIDCAYNVYTFKGSSVSNVYNYVTSLFNAVSTIYGNENISVSISSLNVWTSLDPYDNTSSETELGSFKAYRPVFNGDVAHLLKHNGGNGGLSFVGGLCNEFKYSFSDLLYTYTAADLTFPTYTSDVEVFTHETGHVLGSNHTQWCGWVGGAIDNCAPTEGGCAPGPDPGAKGGTIMSYCGTISFVNGFGPQPGDAIRAGVNGASCLSNCTSACLPVVSVGSGISSGNSVKYSASDILYANNMVSSGASASFTGGNKVILNPGFYAEEGCFFHAWIAPCSSGFISTLSDARSTQESVINKTDNNDNMFLKAYPNPASSEVNLAFILAKTEKILIIQVYDKIGRKVKNLSLEYMPAGKQNIVVDLSNLPSGTYSISLQLSSGQKLSTKVVLIK